MKTFAIYAETHRDGYHGTGTTTHYSFDPRSTDGVSVEGALAVETSEKTLAGYATLPDDAQVCAVMGGEVCVEVGRRVFSVADIVHGNRSGAVHAGIGFRKADGWAFED